MHVAQRQRLILANVNQKGFVSLKDLEEQLLTSPATIRRDLDRLEEQGHLVRVHGGAVSMSETAIDKNSGEHLSGVPFDLNITQHIQEKKLIGRKAASMCEVGESVMIDGGSTTLQMCPHLEALRLQVFTNSLHIVNALLPQKKTSLLLPSGQVFREQNIILAMSEEEPLPNIFAPKLFMGAGAIGEEGFMQADSVLVSIEKRLIKKSQRLIVLVDSSKFREPSGYIVCGLNKIDTLITDSNIRKEHVNMLASFGVNVVICDIEL